VYEVLIEKSAERDLKKIPAADFKRIVPHLKGLAADAGPMGSRKISGSDHDWRIRVGTYRIIYELNDKEKVVKIMRVKQRREAYR